MSSTSTMNDDGWGYHFGGGSMETPPLLPSHCPPSPPTLLDGFHNNKDDFNKDTSMTSNHSLSEMLHAFPTSYQSSTALKLVNPFKFTGLTQSQSNDRQPLRTLQRGFRTPDPTPDRTTALKFNQEKIRYGSVVGSGSKSYADIWGLGGTSPNKEMQANNYKEGIVSDDEIGRQHWSGVVLVSNPVIRSPTESKNISQAADINDIISENNITLTENSENLTSTEAIFSFANIVMGVGILSVPYSLIITGSPLTSLLSVIIPFAFAAIKTSLNIGEIMALDVTEMSSFPAIARLAFGNQTALGISVVLYFELWSCLSIFMVSVGDHLTTLYPLLGKEVFITLSTVFFLLLVLIVNTPKKLSYLSAIGTASIISIVFSLPLFPLFLKTISRTLPPFQQTDAFNVTASSLSTVLGLAANSFSGHAIIPTIYTSLSSSPRKEFPKIVRNTYILVILCCSLVGFSGVYMFGNNLKGQVTIYLALVAGDSYFVKGIDLIMIITTFTKFALTYYPLRMGIEEFLRLSSFSMKSKESNSQKIDLVIPLTITAVAYILATAIPSFSTLCSLVGLKCTTITPLLLPAAAHLKLLWKELSLCSKIIDIGIIVFGVVGGIGGTWEVARQISLGG